jgi:hypothetical protein
MENRAMSIEAWGDPDDPDELVCDVCGSDAIQDQCWFCDGDGCTICKGTGILDMCPCCDGISAGQAAPGEQTQEEQEG